MESFERSGLRFGVVDAGPSDGPVALLFHGFPQQPSTYRAVSERLNTEGVRTLVPEQRGYVASARPTRRRDYRTVELVGDVLVLLDAAGVERAHLVGHDWGAAPAWGMAAWHPERTASITILSTPHPAAMVRAFWTSTQAFRSWYMAFFQLPVLPELLSRRGFTRTLTKSGLPDEWMSAYKAAMSEPGALTGAINWYRGIPFSGLPAMGRIRVPTTYVWGRHDFALNRIAAELTGDYVVGPYRFLDLNAGHWLPETQPDVVAEAILDQIGSAVGAEE
jgi:pimeloyl-ACP methyl ester carboxylesterase